MEGGIGKYMTELNQRLRKGWTAHLNADERIYYLNHETKISSWLPPVDSWDSGGTGLPFGWEAAVDKDGKTYYVNHTNKTTTYECSRKDSEDEAPLPREVVLVRDPNLGFGFVAGSEKPVIVRFVTEGGPNEHKLLPGDQIMKINGEDVIKSPREHVIELIRSCKQSVTLIVCQPQSNNSTRKSALLTAAKKAKLKNNPSRVRFSEGVVINGSPLYSPSPMDSCVPFLPNVLKVFLENGQTKSFKYDSTTSVSDVLNSLNEKLSIKCSDHFSLATEHVNITRRNRLAVLDSNDALSKIAAKPGAHNLRCVFRLTFVPRDAYDLLQKDPVAFEYLYLQCCNDVVLERFAPELKYDIVLRLAALHIQQHALSNGTQGKVTVKAVERESGLERFVPISLLDTMKRKELRKLLSHYLKQNQSLCTPGQKHLTALQAKLHYLKIISELPSYGAKCFTTNLKDSNPELALLVSPRFGVSQIACLRNMNPVTLSRIEDLAEVCVSKEDEFSSNIEIRLKDPDRQSLSFSLEDKDTEEFILLMKGYYRLLTEKELPVQMEIQNAWPTETVPIFHSRHSVKAAPWSYPPQMNGAALRTLDLAVPPPQYVTHEHGRNLSRSSSREKFAPSSASSPTSVDHNMNETLLDRTQEDIGKSGMSRRDSSRCSIPPRICIDERHPGIDYQSVISMELLEDSSGDVDVDVYEAKNDEVINRISEMNRILVDAESYLIDKKTTSSDSSDTDIERHTLKAADSLLLLNHPTTPIPPKEERMIAAGEELSPSESDNDSTPNESPLHRNNPLRNSINGGHSRLRRDSSFGLHSPDLLPTVTPGNNILDILKQLQCEDIPIAEGTLYLDPDIIDLTMIPPPDTPDKESQSMTSPLDAPPTPFLDAGTIHKELEKWIRIPGPPPDDADDHGGLAVVQQNGSESALTVTPENCPDSSSTKRLSVDSTKVVADLDKLCEALSAMQGISLRLNPPIAGSSSMDSCVDNQTVLPSSVNRSLENRRVSDDLAAFIIPPPPSSSPSTEAQNEVIARFMAAAEDMKRMFTSDAGRQFVQDTPQNGFQELQQFWSEIETINPRGSNVLLGHLDALSAVTDLDFHSGDSSSGYDTLTSSLTSYSDTVVSDDVDFTSIPNSAESTPVNEQPPPSVLHVVPSNQQPVLPRLRTTCVDDATSPLSITSPSSTTSSDSSVIQLDGSSSDVLFGEDSQRMMGVSDLNSPSLKPALQTGSCDNLLRDEECELKKSKRLSISRSISWSSLADVVSSKEERHSETSDAMNQKPPIPPNSFQNRLRRSLNREPLRSPVLTRHLSLPHQNSHTNTSTEIASQFPVAVRNGDLQRASSNDPITNNAIQSPINNTDAIKGNGQINGLTTPLPKCPSEQDGSGETVLAFLQNGCVPTNLTNGIPDSRCLDIRSSGPFQQAQKDIAAMVSHLKKISEMTSKGTTGNGSSEDKFSAAKDALVNESRQFVTSSKLFVKSAMESSEKMIENMAICVALLNRMTAISELVVLRGSPGEPVSYLVDRLKEVAVAYFYTVEAAQEAVGTHIKHPHMGTLMQKATTLATALTSLMRTLRAMSML